jgi:ABC-type lipoprotein release transport system permease subunit
LNDHLALVAGGAACGWILSWIVYARVLGGRLEPGAFGAAPALVVVVALVSCWVPARRAALVNPLVALKRE